MSRWFPGERGFVSAVAASGSRWDRSRSRRSRRAQRPWWAGGDLRPAGRGVGAALVVFHFTLGTRRPRSPRPIRRRRACPASRPGRRPGLSVDRRTALGTLGFWGLTVGLMGCGFTDFPWPPTWRPTRPTSAWRPPSPPTLSVLGAANVVGILAAGTAATASGPGRRSSSRMGSGRRASISHWPASRQLYLFAGMFGATFFTTAPLSSTLVGQLFGPAHHGAIFGAANLFHHSAGALGSYAGGLVFDLTGSYRPIFLLAALVVVGSAAVTTLARPAAKPARGPSTIFVSLVISR